MNKQERIMYFMGQVRSQIIILVDRAARRSDDALHHDLVELEQFFNESMAEIFASTDDCKREVQVGVGITLWS